MALLVLITILLLLASSVVITNFTESRLAETQKNSTTAASLNMVRDALLGQLILNTSSMGYLPLPDLGTIGLLNPEGVSSGDFPGNCIGCPVLGKLPWRTLGIGPVRDASASCLWYAVSGRFKSVPSPSPASVLNWDSWEYDSYDGASGRLQLADSAGNIWPGFYAALLVAPGEALVEQDQARDLNETVPECGGNYNARNYLDPWNPAPPGNYTNYFPGSVNNRVAATATDKVFNLAINEVNNDRLLGVTALEIFDITLQSRLRSLLLSSQLSDPRFIVAGPKGTDNLTCSDRFCINWRDHLFVTNINPPTPVTVDGLRTANCRRVVIFSGARTGTQVRATAADRNLISNYLEGTNASSFSTPTAAGTFVGFSSYQTGNRARDIVHCIA